MAIDLSKYKLENNLEKYKIQKEPTFVEKLTNPKTYLDSFVKGQKQMGEFSGVLPVARELARPFISGFQQVKSDITGKPQQSANVPFVGEIKPYANMGKLDTAVSIVDIASTLPFMKAVKATAMSPRMRGFAEKMYESLLKPLKADTNKIVGGGSFEEKAQGIVRTGLAQKIKITRGGLKKLNTMIETIDNEVDTLIEEGKAAGKKVDLYKLVDYVKGVREHYADAFGGEELVKKIDDFTIDFIKPKWDKYGQFVPIEKAQSIKQATYSMVKKFFGAMSDNVEKEVKKQLARGLKDDIARQVPEIDALNQVERKLLDLRPALDRAVQRLNKKDIIGLQDVMVVGSELVATKGKFLGLPSLMWKVVTSPAVKSTIAIRLNELSKLQQSASTLSFPARRVLSQILQMFDRE